MRLALFDVDGTLTTTRVWEGIMAYFREHGLRPWTHRFFWAYHIPIYLLRGLGLVSEGHARAPWAAHLAWYVRGYSFTRAQQVWDWVVENFLVHHWRSDTRALLDGHRRSGDLIVLVSGGPVPLLQRIADELDLQHVVGTQFELRNDHYTGRSLQPVCLDENKALLAKNYLRDQCIDVDFSSSYAYGDSISDLQLLELVGHPVAVYPDDRLRVVANQRDWGIFP